MYPSEKEVRPKLLIWLCVGSAISGFLWIVMLVTLSILSVKGQVPSGLFPGLAVGYLQAGYLFMSVLILLATLGLTGVLMMWQLKKTGFYLYAAAKIVLYFLPVLFISSNHLTLPGLVTTSVPIILYGTLFTGALKNK